MDQVYLTVYLITILLVFLGVLDAWLDGDATPTSQSEKGAGTGGPPRVCRLYSVGSNGANPAGGAGERLQGVKGRAGARRAAPLRWGGQAKA